uniref:Lumbricin n=1 Tax=Eisenia andrei TaxID=168636 RepID=A0A288W7G5_9ANNE|nr:lumbricin [Eisenia andrei]
MYSKYERQKDKRPYSERKNQYTGPQFLYPPERIPPQKVIKWNEEGLPIYEIPGEGGHAEPAAA